MKRELALQRDPGSTLTQYEAPSPQGQHKPAAAPSITARHEDSGHPHHSIGTPSTQSPQEFYAELSRRPKIREILSELAKQ